LGVKKYGFTRALRWEFKHPRKYPQYPFWFFPMIISMVIIAIFLYFYTVAYLPIVFYVFELIVIGYLIFRLIKRLNRIRIKGSILRLWGLKILSLLISGIGILLIYYTMFMFFLTSIETLLYQKSLISEIVFFGHQFNTPLVIPLALLIVGVGLCIIGAYLLFKFKMKSGNVIWVGRI